MVSLATSGRAVVFAGTTVILSLLGLFLLQLPFMRGLAVGAIAAVVLVMAGGRHPAAGHARLRWPGHRQGPRARAHPDRRHPLDRQLLVPLEPHRPAPPGRHRHRRPAGAGDPGHPAVLHAAGLHRRRQRPSGAHHPPGLRPAGRGVRPGLQRPPGAGRHGAARRRPGAPSTASWPTSGPRPAWPSPPRPSSTPPGNTAAIIAYPTTSPQSAADRGAGPPASRGRGPPGHGGHRRARSWSAGRRPAASTPPPTCRPGSSGSSGPSWCWPSCS